MPLDNGVAARKIGCLLSANSNSISSAIWSQPPCGLFSSIEDHFFSEPGPINDHCPITNFFANTLTILAFAKHSFSLPSLSQEMSLNINKKELILWKFLVLLPSRSVDHWPYHRAATLWILGSCSTRIQSALHWFRHSLCSFCQWRSSQSFASKLRWIPDVDGPFQGTTQNLRRRRLLSAEDW